MSKLKSLRVPQRPDIDDKRGEPLLKKGAVDQEQMVLVTFAETKVTRQ